MSARTKRIYRGELSPYSRRLPQAIVSLQKGIVLRWLVEEAPSEGAVCRGPVVYNLPRSEMPLSPTSPSPTDRVEEHHTGDHKHGTLGLHVPRLGLVRKAKAGVLERSIAAAGSRLLALLTRDPYMPNSLKDGIANTFKTTVWPQVTEFLLETLSEQTRVKGNTHREWPECLTAADESWLWRFRCLVLYAINPADMSIWAKLRCPQMLSIFLLLLFPYFGVSLWMMLLLLVCIDWRCDFQVRVRVRVRVRVTLTLPYL